MHLKSDLVLYTGAEDVPLCECDCSAWHKISEVYPVWVLGLFCFVLFKSFLL